MYNNSYFKPLSSADRHKSLKTFKAKAHAYKTVYYTSHAMKLLLKRAVRAPKTLERKCAVACSSLFNKVPTLLHALTPARKTKSHKIALSNITIVKWSPTWGCKPRLKAAILSDRVFRLMPSDRFQEWCGGEIWTTMKSELYSYTQNGFAESTFLCFTPSLKRTIYKSIWFKLCHLLYYRKLSTSNVNDFQ